MFKRDAAGVSYMPMPPRLAASDEVYVVHDRDSSGPARATLVLQNAGDGTINWSADTSSRVTLSSNSGSLANMQSIQVTVNVSGLSLGSHDVGNITVSGSSGGSPVAGSPTTIPVTVVIAEMEHNYLPMFIR
jgi:hypothetical protein